jgi:ABC-type glycerol-3-phosphate transport system permease component
MALVKIGRFKTTSGELTIMAALTLLAMFMALPLVFVVSHSLKPIDELFLFPPRFFVRHPTMRNFQDLLISTYALQVPFVRYVFNSVFVSTATVVGGVLLASLAAYPLAKHQFPGRQAIFLIIIAALMFAVQVTSIPRYLVVYQMGIIDTYWAFIIPNLALPYALFLMRQFMETIPAALIESAKIDGASEWTIFWRVIMPLCKPAWATLVIIIFVNVWNDLWTPLVFSRTEAMRTLPVALQTITTTGSVARQGAAAAATLIVVSPPIIIFTLLQKRVIQTMAHSGIKA